MLTKSISDVPSSIGMMKFQRLQTILSKNCVNTNATKKNHEKCVPWRPSYKSRSNLQTLGMPGKRQGLKFHAIFPVNFLMRATSVHKKSGVRISSDSCKISSQINLWRLQISSRTFKTVDNSTRRQ